MKINCKYPFFLLLLALAIQQSMAQSTNMAIQITAGSFNDMTNVSDFDGSSDFTNDRITLGEIAPMGSAEFTVVLDQAPATGEDFQFRIYDVDDETIYYGLKISGTTLMIDESGTTQTISNITLAQADKLAILRCNTGQGRFGVIYLYNDIMIGSNKLDAMANQDFTLKGEIMTESSLDTELTVQFISLQ